MNSSHAWLMSEYRTMTFNDTALVLCHLNERKKNMDSRGTETEIAV